MLKFITFEGGDGVGKTTHAKNTAKWLQEHGEDVAIGRDPGTTQIGELLRPTLKGTKRATEADFILFMAAKILLLEEFILPALAKGKWVIMDRFNLGCLVYQAFLSGDQQLVFMVEQLTLRILNGTNWPAITFVLDAPVEVARQRKQNSMTDTERAEGTRYEEMDPELRQRIRDGYLSNANHYPGCLILNSNRPEKEVTADIKDALRHDFPLAF